MKTAFLFIKADVSTFTKINWSITFFVARQKLWDGISIDEKREMNLKKKRNAFMGNWNAISELKFALVEITIRIIPEKAK